MSMLLNGLGEALCEGVNIPDVYICRISKNGDNLNTGFVEIAIPYTYVSRKELDEITETYFSDQGYDVNRKQCMVGVMGARKNEEFLWINVTESHPIYRVSISENIYTKAFLTPID